MPNRNYNAGNYRYGFNGKENDKSINEGAQDYGMRIYDKRLGRFFSVDPLAKQYPYKTPYDFAENDVIRSIDLDGLEKYVVVKLLNNDGKVLMMRIIRFTDGVQHLLDLGLHNLTGPVNVAGYNGEDIAIITFNLDGTFNISGRKKFDKIEQLVHLNSDPYDKSGKINKNFNPHTQHDVAPAEKNSPYYSYREPIPTIDGRTSLNVDGIHGIYNYRYSNKPPLNRAHTTYYDSNFNFRATFNPTIESLFNAIWTTRPPVPTTTGTSSPPPTTTPPTTPPVIDGLPGVPRPGVPTGNNNGNI